MNVFASPVETPISRASVNAGLPVDDRVIHDLGPPARLGRVETEIPEDFGGGAGVDVLALAERGDQPRIPAQVGEDPQLDLRIVGR